MTRPIPHVSKLTMTPEERASLAAEPATRGPQTPEEEAAVAAGRAPLGFITLTASEEVAARMAEKRVIGLSIREESLPAPVPAKDHAMFHQSTRYPGVVWPL